MSDIITRAIEIVRVGDKLYDPHDEDIPEGFKGEPVEIEVQINFDFEAAGGDGWNEPRTQAHCCISTVLDIESGNEIPEKIVERHVEGWEEEALDYMAEHLFPDPDEDDEHVSAARLAGARRRYQRMFV